jgi:hypothetical protein
MPQAGDQMYTPGTGGAPFGALQANPQASPYVPTSAYAPAETILLDKAVVSALFDAAPQSFNVMNILFNKPFRTVDDDVFEYLEYTFGRNAIELAANVTAVPAVPNNVVSATLTLTPASIGNVDLNAIIVFGTTNDQAIVRSINAAANTITVQSMTSGGIPAVAFATNPLLQVMAQISADGRSTFTGYQRTKTITRWNMIQQFQRAVRWGRWELQKYKNLARTDYLSIEIQQRMKEMRYDLITTFFNGKKGEYQLATGEVAKATDGIYPMMVNAGSAILTATSATLKATFEAGCMQSDYREEGAVRFAVGTQKVLYELSKSFKEPGIRYTPDNMVANLNLMEYRIGEMRIVPLRVEILRETSLFPADFGNRLFVLDLTTITPVVMKGIPAMESGATLMMGADGTREGFKDWFILAQMGLQFNNPLGSFIINITGI